MTSIVTPIYRSELIASIIDEVISGRATYYLAIGKITPWVDEPNPEIPFQSIDYQVESRMEFVECSRYTQNDISFVCKRNQWTNGVVYDYYDENYSQDNPSHSGALNLRNARFYVINSQNHVYKCIDNNNNSPSTIEPTTNSLNYITTSDGYVWKFLYEIPASQMQSFADINYIPVFTATKSQLYNPGKLVEVNIVSPGSGYDPDVTTLTVTGNGSDAELTPIVDVNTGSITNVIIENPGKSYDEVSIEINSPTGSGGAIAAVLGGGNIDSVQTSVESSAVSGDISNVILESGGAGYLSSDTISISGDGTGAQLSMSVNSNTGAIESINIDNRGSGYTFIDVSIESVTGSGADMRVILSPYFGHGYNAISELFPSSFCFSKMLSNSTIAGQFRKIGIIKNPRTNIDGTNFYGPEGVYTAKIVVDTNWSSISSNEIVKDENGEHFRLVQKDGNEAHLLPLGKVEFVGNTVSSIDDTIVLNISTINQPEINRNTGQLLYIDNKFPYFISPEEFSFLRLYINF